MTEEKKPKFFCCYLDNEKTLQHLSNEQMGALFRALFAYANRGEHSNIDDSLVNMAFTMISTQIDRDFQKYKAKCEKNRENINKRWNNSSTDEYESIQTNTDEYSGMRTNTNYTNSNSSTNSISNKKRNNKKEEEEENEEEEKKEFPRGKEEETPKNDIFISLPTNEGDFDITNAMCEEYQSQYPSNDVSMILHKLKVHCQLNSVPRANIEDLIAQRLWEGT